MAASVYFDQIQQLYIAYLGRPADTAGLAYWAAEADAAGGDLSEIIGGFASSVESIALYAGAESAAQVSSIYERLFNRAPEADGLAYWVDQINSGALSPAQAAFQIQSSAAPADAVTVANKLTAAKAFTAQIDTGAEVAGYAGEGPFSSGRDYLKKVDSDASLAVATSPVTLNAAVAIATNTVVTTPIPDGETFILTTSINKIIGTAFNDTINGTGTDTFAYGDQIDGGAGTDTLDVVSVGAIVDTNVTVTHVEKATFESEGAITLTTNAWTGLNSLTTHSVGATTLTVGSGTTVVVNNVGSASSMGAITITGGSTTNITQTANNGVNTTVTLGAVTVTGSDKTTSVVVKNQAIAIASADVAGVTAGAVTISDINEANASAAGVLTDITVASYAAITINDNALTRLNLKGGTGPVIINNDNVPTTSLELTATLDGIISGALYDSGVYKTLNVVTTGSASTLDNINQAAVTALKISGNQVLNLTSATGLQTLESVVVSGAAGLTADLSGTTITSVNASATSGNITAIINGSIATYSGGFGVDKVTLNSVAPTQTINGGLGTADVLTISATQAVNISTGIVSGFEKLVLTGATNQLVDVSKFGAVDLVSVNGGNGLTLTQTASGDTLELTGAGTAYALSGTFAGGNDTLNLHLTNGSGAGVAFASTGVTTTDVENIVITVTDSQATPAGLFNDSITLLDNSAKNIVVLGNAGLTLTASDTAATTIDASGIIQGGFTFTSGALALAAVIKGSATGTNVIDFSASTAKITYYDGIGNDSITATSTHAAEINLSGGINTVTLGSGDDVVNVGAINGLNTIIFGTGTDSLNLVDIATTLSPSINVSGMSAGDKISFAGALGGVGNSLESTLGTKLTGAATLDAYLTLATAGDSHTQAKLSWFEFSGDTYIVQDTSAASTFTVGADSVVKLSGSLDLSDSTVTAGVVTLGVALS